MKPLSRLDSVTKIASYMHVVAKVPFEYRRKTYRPHPAVDVCPSVFRTSSCPARCGGCCSSPWSLDFLPAEPHPYPLVERIVVFNGRKISLMSDVQEEATRRAEPCRNLDRLNGWCAVHDCVPLSCDMPMVMLYASHVGGPSTISMRPFGRGWNMPRVDGERGALCQIGEPRQAETITRKLKRLNDWADHLGLETWLPEIIAWAESGPHSEKRRFEA